LASYSNNKVYVDIRPSRGAPADSPMSKFRSGVAPNFLLIRNTVTSLTHDHRNLLFGFKYANVPAVNSLESLYNCLERVWVFSELIKIRNRVGEENFPLIEQNYYSNHQEMIITPQYPIVVKVGPAHAGYGKVKLNHHHDFDDIRSLVALHADYSTAEPFIEGEYDLRIQKIGNDIKVYKRVSVSGNWKTNTGTSIVEDVPLTPQYRLWAEESAKMFGGLDILAVDAIHRSDGREFILEVNDSSIGLLPDNEEKENILIKNLVLEKFHTIYG